MLESPPPKQLVPDLPTLVPGLALRELTVKDADAYYKLLDNNRRHLTRLGDYQAEGNATSAWVREHLSTDPGQSLRYGIRLKGELIGRVDLTAADPPRYGTGYWLGEAYVGKGYAMAACAPPIRLCGTQTSRHRHLRRCHAWQCQECCLAQTSGLRAGDRV
ncbi:MULTISPECIES: GNAT family N-acetyltransferase [Streptomyces]|uniref:GNAT family N-acetyltransferase n=1 Tax=Streptomyces TaxID=1883 RepID=UPI001FE2526D|nr:MULTISPECIES: GNAT family N-acetyltransferase [Streptomyces]